MKAPPTPDILDSVRTRDFTKRAPGRLTRTPEGAVAFVPDPLPPADLDLGALVAPLDEASRHLGELAGIGRLLRSPRLLIAPYLRREALLSSRIEGTRSTLTDLYNAEAGDLRLFETTDVAEVRNYVRAMEHGVERLDALPLSLRLLREVHRELMRDARGEERHPGEFRRYQNFVGPPGADVHQARYVPPPPGGDLVAALSVFEGFLHDEGLPPLIHTGLVHYQFEALHPFGDGNGRVGRLLIPLLLHARGLLPQPLLYVSGFFEASRAEYYDRLLAVSTRGDWLGWLAYFLRAVTTQARNAVHDADRLLELERRYRDALRDARPSAQRLMEHLFVNPIVTAARAAEVLQVSDPAARKAIGVLESHGIVRVAGERRWRRRWIAREIYDVITGAMHEDAR